MHEFEFDGDTFMEWFNVFGLVFIVVIMILNIVFAVRCKDDFELEVVGDFLTVKAVKCCKTENEEKKHYVVRERVCETYEESVKLPVQVKGAETKAKYINGVLEISIPRIEEENPKTHVVTIN